jgi:hypothetical protein
MGDREIDSEGNAKEMQKEMGSRLAIVQLSHQIPQLQDPAGSLKRIK